MIILDTNALVYSLRQRIDLHKFISEEIGIPSSVLDELKRLSTTNVNAKLALVLVKSFKILPVDKQGDDGVIEAAIRYGGSVLTNDWALRKRLKERNITTTTITDGEVRRV